MNKMPPTWPYDDRGLLVGSDEWLRRGREMTATDLGLPEYDRAALVAHLLKTNAVYRRMAMGDAPYAFWLGAAA